MYDLGNYMDRKNNLCPNTKYVLVAFSYGTQLTSGYMLLTRDRAHDDSALDEQRNRGQNTRRGHHPLRRVRDQASHSGEAADCFSGYYRAGRPEDRGSATTGSGFKANTGLVIPAEYESLTRNYCNMWVDDDKTGANFG